MHAYCYVYMIICVTYVCICYLCMYLYIYIYIYVHTYIHTNIQTYVYICCYGSCMVGWEGPWFCSSLALGLNGHDTILAQALRWENCVFSLAAERGYFPSTAVATGLKAGATGRHTYTTIYYHGGHSWVLSCSAVTAESSPPPLHICISIYIYIYICLAYFIRLHRLYVSPLTRWSGGLALNGCGEQYVTSCSARAPSSSTLRGRLRAPAPTPPPLGDPHEQRLVLAPASFPGNCVPHGASWGGMQVCRRKFKSFYPKEVCIKLGQPRLSWANAILGAM